MANNDTLTSYGPNFQIKIISCLLSDKVFLQTIFDIINPSYFDSDGNKLLIKMIMGYFTEYKTKPTLDVLKVKIDKIDSDVLKVSVVKNLKEAWRQIESEDLDYVKNKTLEFCRNQVIKSAIMESVELLEGQNYDGIKKVIDEAMKAGSSRDIGHDYVEGLEERLTESVRDVVSTSWDVINEVMDGGLGKGELGVIVAPAGIGKTWMLQVLGSAAVKAGLTVVHYTLELNQTYVGLRYDTVFSGVTTANIKYHQDDVKKVIERLPGKLVIKYYPTRSATVPTLASHLKQLDIQSIKPDLVLVDYADILRDVGGAREVRHQLGNIYEDLRGMAGEFDLPVWTASQANRSSLEEEVIDASKVAESYSKVMTADFVMSVSRKVEDKVANTARAHVIKNRFGVDGITYPVTMNTNIGKVDIFESSTVSGMEVQGKMNNSEEYLRQMAGKKFTDYSKKVEGLE
jgi:replicative DNA helicase|tara:strand:+ start:639 stop:2012 length:1374 start_codon:yes stop_codon:yes gene_type:complete